MFFFFNDIFVACKGTEKQISILLDFLSTLHPDIEFTLEVEENNSINFLDLPIKEEKNKLVFD